MKSAHIKNQFLIVLVFWANQLFCQIIPWPNGDPEFGTRPDVLDAKQKALLQIERDFRPEQDLLFTNSRVFVDSIDFIISSGIADSLVAITQNMGIRNTVFSSWVDGSFIKQFHAYYAFQKELYGSLMEVSLKNAYTTFPSKQQLVYPRFSIVKADVKTQYGSGEGTFEYYESNKDSFHFYYYGFEPMTNEVFPRIDSVSNFFFDAVQQQHYETILNKASESFKNRIENRRKFYDFLKTLNFTDRKQFTSKLNYDTEGLALTIYYALPKQQKYISLVLRRDNNDYVLDGLNFYDKTD